MLELVVVIVLILLNGFFAMSEMAVMTSRKSRLRQQAQSSRRAAKALELAEHPDNFLSTVQIGITLVGILTGVFGGQAIGQVLAPWIARIPLLAPYAEGVGVGLAVALITYFTLIFGELVPKRLAITHAEGIAGNVALPMGWLARLTAPAVGLLALSTRAVLRLFGQGASQAARVTEEEIRFLVAEGHEQGVLDVDERNMMHRVMRLGDRTADSLMTPRMRIAWLDAEADLAENLAVMRETPYSRYPVMRGSDQEVLGVLEVKALVGRLGEGDTDLFRELKPPLFVAESTLALKLLEIFREEQLPLALVVDEYGDIVGMVTQNDLITAVLGRAQAAEHGDTEPLVVTRDDGSLLIDGGLPTDDLRELLGLSELPDEEDHDYNTVAGMVIARYGRIPHAGEHFDWQDWRFEVIDLDGARIDKLLVQRLSEVTGGGAV